MFNIIQRIKSNMRFRKIYNTIDSSGLFDVEYYQNTYKGLLVTKLSPLWHYMLIGAWNGYNPNADFDSAWYMAKYSDVAKSGVNPLMHYIAAGRSEQRLSTPPAQTPVVESPPAQTPVVESPPAQTPVVESPPVLSSFQGFLLKEFTRHAQHEGNTLVVMDEATFAECKEIATRAGIIPCTEADVQTYYNMYNPKRILVSVVTNSYGALAYQKLGWAKDLGIPVIFCLPWLEMRRSAPYAIDSGIKVDGMFHRAGVYVGTLQNNFEPNVAGSYCEFGVFDGRTFSIAYHALKNTCKNFYAFDSFKGIGDAISEETTQFQDGEYYANQATFWYNMRDAGADISRITAVPGLFHTSLNNKTPSDFGISHIFCAHIDVDVYAPALQALQFITPALVDGALILFDDYDHMAADNNRGERRALREWLNSTGYSAELYRSYETFGRAFIIHKT